jgi:sortase A
VRLVLRTVGRFLVATGVLVLLFVAYELWGTNLHEARSQKALKKDFRTVLERGGRVETAPPPRVPEGGALGIIEIPKIGVDKAVVEGVGVPDLKKGPGHYPDTPLPGQAGNSAIAGHRTTYGAPFNRVDELDPGDPIFVTTRQGRFRYDVSETRVVSPTQTEVLRPTDDNRLTLTTCNPKFSARQRLVVVAKLIGVTVPGRVAGATAGFSEANLSGEPSAKRPTILWGTFAAAVALAAWILGRLWRRWAVYLLATPAFLAVLFVFYENVSRLLPANI